MKKTAMILLFQWMAMSIFAQIHCGTERWDVKTLSDPDTININFNQVVPSSVHEQVMMTPPDKIKGEPRRPDESIIYQIKCRILTFKKEGGKKGDKDIHIVIEDPETHETMIAEIPDTVCEGVQGTSRVQQFADLNEWFSDNIGVPTTRFKNLKEYPTVILTGPGFFDFNHGQKGRANNGREIHPVLSMDFAEPLASTTVITKPNTSTNLNTSTMETPVSPLNVLIIILLGAILGATGQGIRVIVGVKKVNDKATSNQSAKDLFDYKQFAMSLFLGLAVGAIAGVLAAVSNINMEITTPVIIAFITAGYAGTDFIEGFIKKNMPTP